MARPRLEAAGPDPRTMALETELRNKLGTRVKIEKRGAAGKITIEFFSEEELNNLLDHIHGGQSAPSMPLNPENGPASGTAGDYDNFTI
jgi:hypothetical protein